MADVTVVETGWGSGRDDAKWRGVGRGARQEGKHVGMCTSTHASIHATCYKTGADAPTCGHAST